MIFFSSKNFKRILFFCSIIIFASCASSKYKNRQKPCDCPDNSTFPKYKKQSSFPVINKIPQNQFAYKMQA